MNRTRVELSLDLLREVNKERRILSRGPGCGHVPRPLTCGGCRWTVAEELLAQHDADARARVDVRQTSIFAVLTKRQP